MIIDRLVLKNFKRFREQTICFHDGITGILGNNGTGKSSIVEAVFFALYGVKATGIAADYIVSSFASPKEKCEVRLDFRVGGDNYTIVRTFKKGKSVTHDATFHRDGKLGGNGSEPGRDRGAEDTRHGTGGLPEYGVCRPEGPPDPAGSRSVKTAGMVPPGAGYRLPQNRKPGDPQRTHRIKERGYSSSGKESAKPSSGARPCWTTVR